MAAGKKKQNRRPPTKRSRGGPAAKAGVPKSPTPASTGPKPKAPSAREPIPVAATGPTKLTQAERLDVARRARARKKRNVRLGVGAAVALIVGLLVANMVSNRNADNALRDRLEAGSCNFDTRSDPTTAAPNNHRPPARYQVDPPAGGNHDPVAASAGDFQAGNAPPDAQVVHALEHGYIAVWYRPDLGEEDLSTIRDALQDYERDVLILPRESLTQEVAATAWGERLLCAEVEGGPLTEFVKAYRNKGPEAVPHP